MKKGKIIGFFIIIVFLVVVLVFILWIFLDIGDGGWLGYKLGYGPYKMLFHPKYKKIFILKNDRRTIEVLKVNYRWDIEKEREYIFQDDIKDFLFAKSARGEFCCFIIQDGKLSTINIEKGYVDVINKDWSKFQEIIYNGPEMLFIGIDMTITRGFLGIKKKLPGKYVDNCIVNNLSILLLKEENCILVLESVVSSIKHRPYKLDSIPKDIEVDDKGQIYVLFDNEIKVFIINPVTNEVKFIKKIRIKEDFDEFLVTPRSNEILGINKEGITNYEWIYMIRNKIQLAHGETKFHNIFIYGKNKHQWDLFYYDVKGKEIKIYWSYSEGYDQKELENYPRTTYWKNRYVKFEDKEK